MYARLECDEECSDARNEKASASQHKGSLGIIPTTPHHLKTTPICPIYQLSITVVRIRSNSFILSNFSTMQKGPWNFYLQYFVTYACTSHDDGYFQQPKPTQLCCISARIHTVLPFLQRMRASTPLHDHNR